MTQKLSYEEAFERLEKILEQMNHGGVSLEDSLKLFAEAEHLMQTCTTSLNHAEKTIEKLIKDRNLQLSLNEENLPRTEPMNLS